MSSKIRMSISFLLTAILCLFQLSYAEADEEAKKSEDFLHLPESEVNEEKIITEISFGCEDDDKPIVVYISPSCIHCAKFVIGEFKKVVDKHKSKRQFILKFLPTSAKDIFIMKIIQNEVKDENGFFIIFENYIKRCLATINHISPTKEQEELYRGSNVDPDMIKFQVEASEFGFSDEKIIASIPDMDGDYEKKLMNFYKECVEDISESIDSKDVELPLIEVDGKICRTLSDALEA